MRKRIPLTLIARLLKSPAQAVAEILEIQKRNRLGGLKIKDLIHEGHKY
ncbi:MAG TPA: hypothetical protein VFZ27_14400 [Terriglobia bacterium]|nr:hypothetical protein [Terriglobia bacterium]